MIIRDEVDGLVIPCEDTAALTAAFAKLLSSPEKLTQMGEAARQRVCESFTIQKEAEGLNSVYHRIMDSELVEKGR